MARFQHPFSYEFSINLGGISAYFFLNENVYVQAAETCSVPHNHMDSELRFFESGTVCYTVGESKYLCQAGDYLLIPTGLYHAQLDRDNGSPACAQYNLRFSISVRPKKNEGTERKAIRRIADYLATPRFVHGETQRLGQLLHMLADEIYSQRPGYIVTIKALCTALAVEILRPLGADVLRLFADDQLAYSGYMRTVIDNFFIYRYLEPVTIHDLAGEMQVSVRQASRVFQRVYGMSFSKKLREMRVEAAKVLLRTTDRKMEDIAAACGFETYSYFFTSFKAQEQMSPQAYRQRQKETQEKT